MKIAIFTDTYYPETNGIAISGKILVDLLKKNEHDVIVITSIYDQKIPTNQSGIYYISFKKNKKRSVFTTVNIYNSTIFKDVKNFKPDIVHDLTNGHIGQIGRYTAEKLRIPLVYTYHTHFEDYAPYVESGIMNRFSRARGRNDLKIMMNASTEFIAPSIKIKNYLRKKGVDRYINVLTTAIDVKQFEIDESVKKDNKYLHKKYEIDDNAKVLTYIGALSQEKNIDLLINCFKKYLDNKEYPFNVYLIIVGEGDQLDNLKHLSSQLGIEKNVIFAGKVNHDKIKSYLDITDIFVSASTSETQSISTMEAMAAYTIPLVKDDETLINLIERDKNGYIFTDDEGGEKRVIVRRNAGDVGINVGDLCDAFIDFATSAGFTEEMIFECFRK